jgi:two-component system response regulator RpaA
MQTILVVDDDPGLVELLSLSFEHAGFAVIAAANGIAALKQARSHRPDLILLDLVLPEMDGFTVCETLRKDPATASIPIIMLTGLTSQFNRLSGLDCGANDYVTKPVTLDELLPKIRALLSHSAQ